MASSRPLLADEEIAETDSDGAARRRPAGSSKLGSSKPSGEEAAPPPPPPRATDPPTAAAAERRRRQHPPSPNKTTTIQKTACHLADTCFLTAGGDARARGAAAAATAAAAAAAATATAPAPAHHHHHHGHGHDHDHGGGGSQTKVTTRLIWATALCFVFMLVELVGGYLASSVAIMSDAAHLLSDVSAFLVSIAAAYAVAQRPAPAGQGGSYSYGFHRTEVLAALVSALMIWAVTGALVWEAVQRVIKPVPVDGKLMFCVSVAAVLFNVCIALVLGGHGHLHSHGGGGCGGHSHSTHDHHHDHHHGPDEECGGGGHGPSHGGTAANGHSGGDAQHRRKQQTKKEHAENLALRGAVLHVIGDLLQSCGVALAGALIWRYGETHPAAYYADPACTFLFSILVLLSTKGILADVFHVLMERAPADVDMAAVEEGMNREIEAAVAEAGGGSSASALVAAVAGGASSSAASLRSSSAAAARSFLHDLHVWSLSTGLTVLTAHVHVPEGVDPRRVVSRLEAFLRGKGLTHTTIQTCAMEEGDEDQEAIEEEEEKEEEAGGSDEHHHHHHDHHDHAHCGGHHH
jgi:zinc transporter 2